MNGGTQLAVYETFEDLFGRKSTFDELIAEVRTFQQQSVLWVCAVIVTGMQLWNRVDLQPSDVYQNLIRLFFDPSLQGRLIAGYWVSEPRRVLFHRRQILLIAKLAIVHCTGHGLDARTNAQRFGSVLLKANDQFHYGLIAELGLQNRPVSEREDFAKIITEMLAVGEHSSAHIAHLITRNHLMLTRFSSQLRGDPDFVDVAGEHERTTELTLEEFEAMIFGVHARFGEELVRKLFAEPGVLPLKDANFATTAIPAPKVRSFIDSVAALPEVMAQDLQQRDNGPNDFTIFRKYPLIQQFYNMHLNTAWYGFLMMDNLFFLEKVLTGPYWTANAAYGLTLRKFWGSVFEAYVNELMRRACAGTSLEFIPDPRCSNDTGVQICDGIVASDDSLVLIEYKSSMFRADTKYGGNHSTLGGEIEKKLVHDKEAGQKKGVWQLADAIENVFVNRCCVLPSNICTKNLKRVYLLIITLDTIGSTIGMSPFLNTFLEQRIDRSKLRPLDIRPLFCTDIETLETITGYFQGSIGLPQILEQWFTTNPSLTTPLSAVDLATFQWRENEWLLGEWHDIYKKMVAVLFPDKDPEAALTEAIRRARQRRPS